MSQRIVFPFNALYNAADLLTGDVKFLGEFVTLLAHLASVRTFLENHSTWGLLWSEKIVKRSLHKVVSCLVTPSSSIGKFIG